MKWFFIIYSILFVLSVIYRFTHKRRKDQLEIISPANKIGYKSISSFNGIGTSIVGGFPTEIEDKKVYYIVFSILFVPILRLKCVLGKKIEDGAFHQEFEFFGELRSDPLEILSVMIIRGALVVFAFGLVSLMNYNP